MAEETKDTKKIEELKETPENKKAIAESEGKVAEEKIETKEEEKVENKESKPAVEKVSKKAEKKSEGTVELEREYIVPMRKGIMNVPRYRRAKKAVKTLKEFMVKHMNVRDNDIRKVKVDINLNNEIWFRGIKKPLTKVKVLAKKIDGIVHVTLADPADYVKFKLAREAKKKLAQVAPEKPAKAKKEKVADANKDGVEDKVEERKTQLPKLKRMLRKLRSRLKPQNTLQKVNISKRLPQLKV